jgi:hypothetical protein
MKNDCYPSNPEVALSVQKYTSASQQHSSIQQRFNNSNLIILKLQIKIKKGKIGL